MPRRIFIVAGMLSLLSVVLGTIWIRAGGIPIYWTMDVDVHRTAYHKECDPIVQRAFKGHGRTLISADQYQIMVRELAACNRTTETPTARR